MDKQKKLHDNSVSKSNYWEDITNIKGQPLISKETDAKNIERYVEITMCLNILHTCNFYNMAFIWSC